jgi:AmmeMemoRadiSam system protein A
MSQLRDIEKRTLLEIARDAVTAHLAGIPVELPDVPEGNLAATLGVFVTIHYQYRLRGCVGNIQPQWPLYITTARCAVAAATHDPRFQPLQMNELEAVAFEVSVLGELELLTDPMDLEIGRHGLIAAQQQRQGLLLPQVALNQGWNKTRFLEETCAKAGLQRNAWQNEARIYRFTAEVFSET